MPIAALQTVFFKGFARFHVLLTGYGTPMAQISAAKML
jgi:hypothetical protein